MKDQTALNRHQLTPEEEEGIARLLLFEYPGPHLYRPDGRCGINVVRYDRVEDVPPEWLEDIRAIPYEVLVRTAVGDLGYLIFVRSENGERIDGCVFLTRGLAKQTHPFN